jgi:hypothetical protein
MKEWPFSPSTVLWQIAHASGGAPRGLLFHRLGVASSQLGVVSSQLTDMGSRVNSAVVAQVHILCTGCRELEQVTPATPRLGYWMYVFKHGQQKISYSLISDKNGARWLQPLHFSWSLCCVVNTRMWSLYWPMGSGKWLHTCDFPY